jgi:hypothetical protein
MERPPIRLTESCVGDYIERARPVSRERAREELALLLQAATVRAEPPEPTQAASGGGSADAWLWLDEDGNLFAPLLEEGGRYRAVALYARGSVGDLAREYRNRAKRRERRRRVADQLARHSEGRRRSELGVDEW